MSKVKEAAATHTTIWLDRVNYQKVLSLRETMNAEAITRGSPKWSLGELVGRLAEDEISRRQGQGKGIRQ